MTTELYLQSQWLKTRKRPVTASPVDWKTRIALVNWILNWISVGFPFQRRAFWAQTPTSKDLIPQIACRVTSKNHLLGVLSICGLADWHPNVLRLNIGWASTDLRCLPQIVQSQISQHQKLVTPKGPNHHFYGFYKPFPNGLNGPNGPSGRSIMAAVASCHRCWTRSWQARPVVPQQVCASSWGPWCLGRKPWENHWIFGTRLLEKTDPWTKGHLEDSMPRDHWIV